jgi:hypothetical protein
MTAPLITPTTVPAGVGHGPASPPLVEEVASDFPSRSGATSAPDYDTDRDDPAPSTLTEASKRAVNAALDEMRDRLAGPPRDPLTDAAERLQQLVDTLTDQVRELHAAIAAVSSARVGADSPDPGAASFPSPHQP